ncbi:MAG TPA: hypothetical protein V6C58_14570 [Allocoleopsis sp.]
MEPAIVEEIVKKVGDISKKRECDRFLFFLAIIINCTTGQKTIKIN